MANAKSMYTHVLATTSRSTYPRRRRVADS